MEQGLLVTVILPLFNAGRFLSTMLESLHAQNYRPMQVVLWDDGSTDGTELVAEKWARSHTSNSFEVVLHREEENRGICASVSGACQLAKGVYWAFADQDDAWEAGKVSVEAALLEAESATSIVFCDRQLMDSSDRILCTSEYRYLGFRRETGRAERYSARERTLFRQCNAGAQVSHRILSPNSGAADILRSVPRTFRRPTWKSSIHPQRIASLPHPRKQFVRELQHRDEQ